MATSGAWADLTADCLAIAAERQCEVTHVHLNHTHFNNAGPALLRFYTPSGQVAFCGHGALAAAAWVAKAGLAHTRLLADYGGGAVLELTSDDEGGAIGFVDRAGPVQPVALTGALLDTLRTMLGLPGLAPSQLTCWTGGPVRRKALLRLESPQLLAALQIDAATRERFCDQTDVTGIYPYVECAPGRTPRRILARHFPRPSGSIEDIATGNIAATVAAHVLAHVLAGTAETLIIDQGGPNADLARLQVVRRGEGWMISGACRVDASGGGAN